MKKKLRLTQAKASRKKQAVVAREKQEAREKRATRPWLSLLRELHSNNGEVTRDQLAEVKCAVNARIGHVMTMKEAIECFSATQREKVFLALRQLVEALRSIASALSPAAHDLTAERGRSEGDLEGKHISVLGCKQAILECKHVLEVMDGRMKALDKVAQREQKERLQNLSFKVVQQADDSSNEIEDLFGFVRLFAPLEALKLQNSLKRSLGAAFLKKMGIEGLRVAESHLDVKLEEMFGEIDADNGGDIDFEGRWKLEFLVLMLARSLALTHGRSYFCRSATLFRARVRSKFFSRMAEMSTGLAEMGVSVSDKELKKFLQDFDSDGNMLLDRDEFKEMIKAVLRDCKVVIEKDVDASRRLNRRPASICVEEEDGAENEVARTGAGTGQKSATPAWRKLKAPVHYSHLSTPPHILKRRVEVADKRAAMRKARTDGEVKATDLRRTPSSTADSKKSGTDSRVLRHARGMHLEPLAGALVSSPSQHKLRTPSSGTTRNPKSKDRLSSKRASRKHV